MQFFDRSISKFSRPSTDQILQTIKPIETVAFDHKFRSRLEARWASFFEHLDITWEYEREGYDINGVWYLPDYYLPHVGLRNAKTTGIWVEIKPMEYGASAEDTAKYFGLYELTRRPLLLFKGIPDYDEDRGSQYGDPHDGDPWWDNWMVFCKCFDPSCAYIKVEFSESNYMNCPRCGAGCSDTHPDILDAITAAKQARFEHGEIC